MWVCFNPAAEPEGNVAGEDGLQVWPLARFTRAGWLRKPAELGTAISRIDQTQKARFTWSDRQ